MTSALATVERLSARLGVALTPDTPDYARAEDALWSASVRARDIANQEWEDASTVPDVVLDVVLSAAMRVFKNPDRFLTNQAGSFQATLSNNDFVSGDIFLDAEVRKLERFRPDTSLWVQGTYRDDPETLSGPHDPANYVPDPISGGIGDPFYIGPGLP